MKLDLVPPVRCDIERARGPSTVRRGISIIEVLISIVVATVGVFGVFALIPFAIRQAEIGINDETAITLARNGIADFENQGCSAPSRWAIRDFRDDNGMNGTTDYLRPFDPATVGNPPNPICSSEVYCIDPWGWAQHELADVNFNFAPYSDFAGAFPRLRRISLFQPGVAPATEFDRSLARRMFSSPDDVLTTVEKDALDLEFPNQQYFSGGSRQYSGRTSWLVYVARALPAFDDFRFYTVVYQNRDTNASRAATETARLYDRLFRVEMPNGATNPLYQVGGGDLRIRELSAPLVSDSAIRRGTWIMLIASNDSVNDPVVQAIGFYRVIEADVLSATQQDITLQGGDFILTPSATSAGDSTYYAVVLPDVLTVYERTMRIPSASQWN